MNVMPDPTQFELPQLEVLAPLLEDEQAVLGAALNRPQIAAEAFSRLQDGDIAHPFHIALLDAMRALHADGRGLTPQALSAVLGPEREIEPGLNVDAYVRKLGAGGVHWSITPLAGVYDRLRDARHRRELVLTGQAILASASQPWSSVSETCADAMSSLDSLVVGLRKGRMVSMTAEVAAMRALQAMRGESPNNPTTGLADLDEMVGGWPRGQLSVIAGRPGMGKSAVATSALLKAAQKGFTCQFFSLEMTGEQLGARLLSDLAYTAQRPIAYDDIGQRRVNEFNAKRLEAALQQLRGLPIKIEVERGVSITEISARARKHAEALAAQGQTLNVIFVDHMLLVKPSARYSGNRVREVAEISDGLATLAKELDCAVVALCQLNRAVEGRDNKRPSLSDLRDSGAIEEDASVVVFVYRPAYYLENTREDDRNKESERQAELEQCRHLIEYVVAKNRNGRVGVVRAWCDIGANAIRNLNYGG